MTNHTYICHTV